jgi:CheY-like chemotaxis protein
VIVCDETGGLAPGLERYLDDVDLVRVHSPLDVSQQMTACPADAVMLNVAVPRDLCARFDEVRLRVPGTPIVGCAFPAPAERAVASGATGHLVKPVSRVDLKEAIRHADKPVKRVLVVDDDPDVLGLFARMLRVCDDSLAVETADSGEEALARVQAEPFDLVFLDVVLPAMDGWEVLARLRAYEGLADVPVYVVSAQDLADRPPASDMLLASVEDGLSVKKALRCSLELASLLLTPDAELDPAPPQNGVAG